MWRADMLGSGVLATASGAIGLGHSAPMKVSTRGGVLTLTLLVAHAKCVLFALHKEGREPLACTRSGAFLAFATSSSPF